MLYDNYSALIFGTIVRIVKDKKEAEQVRLGQIVRVRKAVDTREQVGDLFRQLSC